MVLEEVTDYKVCPRCGNVMYIVNDKWCCRICGYYIPITISLRYGKVNNLYTTRKQ